MDDKNDNIPKKTEEKREVDILAEDVYSWWGKAFVYMRRKNLKPLKVIVILAFLAGLVTALIWSISISIR